MQHHQTSPTNSAETGPPLGPGTAQVVTGGEEARAIGLAAMRELRAPLGALRVLLEGCRSSDGAGREFSDRALDEIDRAEAAADDLLAWTLPRSLRTTQSSLGELVQGVREALRPADRRRTHFVIENEDTALDCDARLLTTSFARSIRHAYRDAGARALEIMVHAHASKGRATLSFIHSGDKPDLVADEDGVPSLADALLRSSLERSRGTINIHEAEGHRCAVVTIPTSDAEAAR
ncbi:MAG: hypothetical protein AAGG01_15190 [Planctomycetota bacterium]